ncbi:hypothetical protein BDV3_005777 [Batrachochytrium dendrobatidis]
MAGNARDSARSSLKSASSNIVSTGATQFVKESFRQLNKRADVHVDSTVPIKRYVQSAPNIWRQAISYEKENDLVQTYIMFMRYTVLGVTELKKHPDYKSPAVQGDIQKIQMNCAMAITKLERIRPLLEKRYSAIEQANIIEMDRRKREYAARVEAAQIALNAEKMKANQHSDMSVHTERVSSGSAMEGQLYDDEWWRMESGSKSDGQSMTKSIQSELPAAMPTYSLPVQSTSNISASLPPPIPFKPSNAMSALLGPEPSYESLTSPTYKTIFDDSLEGKLRKMHLPRRLMQEFLKRAQPNTSRNLETCGILCGRLQKNEFTITNLVIPKQTATSDTCSTTNEEDLIEFQDKRDLITLGWIHTHPSQSCFLSSVDLHTHCSYQLMLPEAIAIVMAPSKTPSQGIFRLTDPPGIDVVTACRDPQMFHLHEGYEGQLYESTEKGHVYVSDEMMLDITDMRV